MLYKSLGRKRRVQGFFVLKVGQHRLKGPGKGAVPVWREVDAIKRQLHLPETGIEKGDRQGPGQGAVAFPQPG